MTTPNPQVSPAGTASREPAMSVGTRMLLGWLVVAVGGYFGIPVDDKTKAIAVLVLGALMPLAQAAWTRLKAWSPASVAKLWDDSQQLIREAQSDNPPAVITADPLTVGPTGSFGGQPLPQVQDELPETVSLDAPTRHTPRHESKDR